MSDKHWSFLHEWVIYDYLLARAAEKTLRLKNVITNGKLESKPKWVKVEDILPIIGTSFPDIKAIKFKSDEIFRQAEVKFRTSLFNYHREFKHQAKFDDFVKNNGVIIALAHDYLPLTGLLEKHNTIEVFTIELEDFVSYCRENFTRLLNRQIKIHQGTRIWLMYQGPNFNKSTHGVHAARESMIWCPTDNLNSFDLAPGDRVLFYKTLGVDRIKVQNALSRDGVIHEKWRLEEIFVAEITSKIFSRAEYCQWKKIPIDKQLWVNEGSDNKRWNRVFSFKKIKVIEGPFNLRELYQNSQSASFVRMAFESFCYIKSREISHEDYRNFLEVIA